MSWADWITIRLKDAKGQVAIKEKSCKESQKAYAKEQSIVKNLQKELTTIEVSCTITYINHSTNVGLHGEIELQWRQKEGARIKKVS